MFPLSNSPEDTPFLTEGAQKALHVPVGASSPLWFLFAGAAGAGVAFWWMTRWTQATNLEALLAAPQAAVEPPSPTEIVAPSAPEPETLLALEPEAAIAPEPPAVEPEPASFAAIAEAAAEETPAPKPARAKPARVARTDGEASAD